MLLPWIVCGLIIFASTIGFIQKKAGVEVPVDKDLFITMIIFGIMGPISIFFGSMILNDFNNKF